MSRADRSRRSTKPTKSINDILQLRCVRGGEGGGSPTLSIIFRNSFRCTKKIVATLVGDGGYIRPHVTLHNSQSGRHVKLLMNATMRRALPLAKAVLYHDGHGVRDPGSYTILPGPGPGPSGACSMF